MNRRGFIALAAAAAATPKISVAKQSDLEMAIRGLEQAIRDEMPGVTRVEVKCCPDDPNMPLMVLAYRD